MIRTFMDSFLKGATHTRCPVFRSSELHHLLEVRRIQKHPQIYFLLLFCNQMTADNTLLSYVQCKKPGSFWCLKFATHIFITGCVFFGAYKFLCTGNTHHSLQTPECLKTQQCWNTHTQHTHIDTAVRCAETSHFNINTPSPQSRIFSLWRPDLSLTSWNIHPLVSY